MVTKKRSCKIINVKKFAKIYLNLLAAMTWTLRTIRQKKKKHYVILLKAFAYGFKGGEASGPAPPGSSLIFIEKKKMKKK